MIHAQPSTPHEVLVQAAQRIAAQGWHRGFGEGFGFAACPLRLPADLPRPSSEAYRQQRQAPCTVSAAMLDLNLAGQHNYLTAECLLAETLAEMWPERGHNIGRWNADEGRTIDDVWSLLGAAIAAAWTDETTGLCRATEAAR